MCHTQVSFLEITFFMGFVAGNGLFGGLADRFGRRRVMQGCTAAAAALTALSACVPANEAGFWLHAIMHVASAVFTSGMVLAAYVLATEFVGPRMRGAAGELMRRGRPR